MKYFTPQLWIAFQRPMTQAAAPSRAQDAIEATRKGNAAGALALADEAITIDPPVPAGIYSQNPIPDDPCWQKRIDCQLTTV